MKITFITSGLGLSGGNKAIFEISNYLVDMRHNVTLVCSLTPFIFEQKWFNPKDILTRLLRLVKKSKGCNQKIDWFDLKARVLPVLSLKECYIPDADIILATWWETAYFVKKYSARKGKKFYFVQDYEDWLGQEKKVRKSYQLDLKIIVNSNWLKETLLNKTEVRAEKVILHAPDHRQFYPEKMKREKKYFRILMPYREEARKGTKQGFKIMKRVQEKYPNTKLVLFGQHLPKEKNLLDNVEFHLRPIKDNLRRVYNSCDIFLYPVLKEGFGMPPMEAMACKIPVVTTSAGAIPEYVIANKTALVSKPGDINTMIENIIRLIENDDLRKKIAEAGYLHIQKFTWEKTTRQLENVFKKYL